MEHFYHLLFGFLARGMGSMALLPQEFSRTEEHPRAHFPTHDIGPLVDKQRKIAIRVDPVLISIPYYSLGCRTYYKFFFESGLRIDNNSISIRIIFQTVMRYDSTFFRETFDMLGLTAEKRLRYKQREICILVTCLLEHIVKLTLHFFPYSVAIRLDNHTSAHGRLFREISLDYEFVIPLRVIVRSFC